MNRNFLWLFLNQGLGRGTLFLFFLLLPRWMDFEAYTSFSFTFVFLSTLFLPFMEFGLDLAVVKYASRDQTSRIRQAFFWRGVLIALSFLGGILCAALGRFELGLALALLVYLSLLMMQSLFFAQLRGYECMHVEGIAGGLQRTLPVLILVWGAPLLTFPGYEAYLPAWILLIAIVFGWGIILTCFRVHVARLRRLFEEGVGGDRSEVLKEGLVLGVAALMASLYFRIDSVMLGFLISPAAAAQYFAASKILEATFVFPYMITLVVFPRMSNRRLGAESQRKLLLFLAASGLSVAAAFYWVAPAFAASFYGPELSPVQPILRVLALSVLPVYMGHLLTQSLVSRDRRGAYIKLTAVGLLSNIAMNALLIPTLGAEGAAWATFLTECLISAGAFLLLRSVSLTKG